MRVNNFKNKKIKIWKRKSWDWKKIIFSKTAFIFSKHENWMRWSFLSEPSKICKFTIKFANKKKTRKKMGKFIRIKSYFFTILHAMNKFRDNQTTNKAFNIFAEVVALTYITYLQSIKLVRNYVYLHQLRWREYLDLKSLAHEYIAYM